MKQIEYEWVVEAVNADGDSYDVDYYDEPLLAQALAAKIAAARDPEAHRIDFGICRHNNDPDALIPRQYAYFENGCWPETFDYGTPMPKRLMALWGRHA